jgi:hypothetical protein
VNGKNLAISAGTETSVWRDTRVLYQGLNGTTIDAIALNQELAANSMMLRFNRDDAVTIGKVQSSTATCRSSSSWSLIRAQPRSTGSCRASHWRSLPRSTSLRTKQSKVWHACSDESYQSLRSGCSHGRGGGTPPRPSGS